MPRLHRVAILALPSVVPFDLAVPVQVFGYPRPDLGAMRYQTRVCGVRKGRVEACRGFDIMVPHGLELLSRVDTIVIPGFDDTKRPIDPRALAALRRAHARGARLISICTGAFALAEAGILDGQRATTHWADVPEFRGRFPHIPVEPDVLYVDNGQVLTSAGIASGIDLCLHVVALDHGAAVANAVARRLVVAPHRSGGQAQFVPAPSRRTGAGRLAPTLEWARARLADPLTVPRLAEHAGMPVRSFVRRFRSEAGLPPLQWLLQERVRAAQLALETSDDPVERIAARCGFGSAASLRVHFARAVRTSPLAYRAAFRKRS